MASGENNDRLTLDIMRGIVERLQAAHAPLGGRLDALVSAACSDGMAGAKDGRIITVAEMCRDDLVDQPPLTIARIDPTPGYCPPKETGGFMMTGEDFDSFTLDEKQSLGLVSRTVQWAEPQDPTSWSEAPVTPEIVSAGRSVVHQAIEEFRALGPRWDVGSEDYWAIQIYRAMHAVAPVELVPEGERIAVKERDEAYRYLRGIFEHIAPQCTPLPDLMGMCTQIDNLIAGLRMDSEAHDVRGQTVRELLEERDRANAGVHQLRAERNNILIECQRYVGDINKLSAQLAAKDQRIAELDSELASVANPEPKKPPHDPFAVKGDNPRRMGPLV